MYHLINGNSNRPYYVQGLPFLMFNGGFVYGGGPTDAIHVQSQENGGSERVVGMPPTIGEGGYDGRRGARRGGCVSRANDILRQRKEKSATPIVAGACWHCKRQGHFARNCPVVGVRTKCFRCNQWDHTLQKCVLVHPAARGGPRRCWNCGIAGHRDQECRKKCWRKQCAPGGPSKSLQPVGAPMSLLSNEAAKRAGRELEKILHNKSSVKRGL